MADKPFVAGECDIDARQKTLTYFWKSVLMSDMKNES